MSTAHTAGRASAASAGPKGLQREAPPAAPRSGVGTSKEASSYGAQHRLPQAYGKAAYRAATRRR